MMRRKLGVQRFQRLAFDIKDLDGRTSDRELEMDNSYSQPSKTKHAHQRAVKTQ